MKQQIMNYVKADQINKPLRVKGVNETIDTKSRTEKIEKTKEGIEKWKRNKKATKVKRRMA